VEPALAVRAAAAAAATTARARRLHQVDDRGAALGARVALRVDEVAAGRDLPADDRREPLRLVARDLATVDEDARHAGAGHAGRHVAEREAGLDHAARAATDDAPQPRRAVVPVVAGGHV